MSKLQKSGPKCLKSRFQMSKLADNIRNPPNINNDQLRLNYLQ